MHSVNRIQKIRVFGLSNFIIIKNQIAVSWDNSLSPRPEHNELGLGSINGHFVRSEPIGNLLQLNIHICGEVT
jgi:hypothetical protein